jgi:hypothetical protein
VVFLLIEFPLRQQKYLCPRCALLFVDTCAHTLLLEVYFNFQICSWSCHCDWLVQIAAKATDAVMPSIVVLETKELDIFVLDDESNTMESETGPYVWCHD